MTCGGCENAIKLSVSQLNGVLAVTASHKDSRVEVTYDSGQVAAEKIKHAIEELGYRVPA